MAIAKENNMPNGIYHGLSADDYFKANRINCSGLKLINQSPLHYKHSLEQQREETQAMKIGSAVHCAVLESSEFEKRYIVMPDGIDRRTKEGKALCAEMEESGKIILSANDYKMIDGIAQSVKSHESASKLLGNGRPEMTVFTEIDGVPAKCRIDWYRSNVIVDLKTTEDASLDGFQRSVAKYGYHSQSAWYLDCCESLNIPAQHFIFIAVEKTEPYAVGVYELDSASIEVGRTLNQRALDKYRQCLETNNWHGYPTDIQTLSLPAWAMRENYN